VDSSSGVPSKKSKTMVVVQIGFYRKEDWARLIEIVEDKEVMHQNWEDWFKDFMHANLELEQRGIKAVKKVVDIDKLAKYCKKKGLKNVGSTRAQYIRQLK
jgi:3-isopropylmalate dehydratase small subunit